MGKRRDSNSSDVKIPSQDKEVSHGCGTPKQCLLTNLLFILLFLAMVIGIGIGFAIRTYYPEFRESSRKVMYLEFPGTLLMNMLKMMIIPLIVSSLISGMANLPSSSAGWLGLRTILYYLLTTLLAVILGIILVTTIKPGTRGKTVTVGVKRGTYVEPSDALLDLIRNAFPNNLVGACSTQARTVYPTYTTEVNETVGGPNGTIESVMKENFDYSSPKVSMVSGSNVLGLVVFSIAFGVVVGRMGRGGALIRHFFYQFSNAIIKLVIIIIWYSPIGIIFLLAARIVKMKDPGVEFEQLGYYIATVLAGLLIHGFIFLPSIYLIFTRKNPFRFMFNMGQALLTALGTASSSATLPVTLRCLMYRARVHPTVGRFVLPVGATVNMDGTALYEAVASIFIAQYENIPLNAGQIVIVSITSTAAAIGAAGIPEAGLVTMVIVLTAVGLPIESVGLIYAVDWFLDRCRTTINVWGDAIGAGVVEAMSKKDLGEPDFDDEDEEFVMSNGEVNVSYANENDSITQM